MEDQNQKIVSNGLVAMRAFKVFATAFKSFLEDVMNYHQELAKKEKDSVSKGKKANNNEEQS